jgi:transposase
MEDKINILLFENEELKNENAELRCIIKGLEDTISLLKGGRNSRTSSTSPSHDLGRSNHISLRPSSGRKPGGQPGHAGHSFQMSDTVDEVVDHTPCVCRCCGETLDEVLSDRYTRRQLIDLPEIRPVYTEHRRHEKTCPVCGMKNRGVFPDHIVAPVQYGAVVEATAGYLSAYQYLPYRRIVRLFKDCFGLPLSEGVLDNFLERLSDKSTSAYETIRNRIQNSDVVGSDETGCRVNGKKYWFHVWQNRFLTYIVAFAHRSYQVIEEYFSDGFLHSVYVSDCYAAQLKTPAQAHTSTGSATVSCALLIYCES